MKIKEDNKLKLIISIVIIGFFILSLFSCFISDDTKDFENEDIDVELEETVKLTIAESLQKSAEKCEYIVDFCDVLEKKDLFPVLDLKCDSLMIYYTYIFDDSKLEVITNRNTRKIIAVKVVK